MERLSYFLGKTFSTVLFDFLHFLSSFLVLICGLYYVEYTELLYRKYLEYYKLSIAVSMLGYPPNAAEHQPLQQQRILKTFAIKMT